MKKRRRHTHTQKTQICFFTNSQIPRQTKTNKTKKNVIRRQPPSAPVSFLLLFHSMQQRRYCLRPICTSLLRLLHLTPKKNIPPPPFLAVELSLQQPSYRKDWIGEIASWGGNNTPRRRRTEYEAHPVLLAHTTLHLFSFSPLALCVSPLFPLGERVALLLSFFLSSAFLTTRGSASAASEYVQGLCTECRYLRPTPHSPSPPLKRLASSFLFFSTTLTPTRLVSLSLPLPRNKTKNIYKIFEKVIAPFFLSVSRAKFAEQQKELKNTTKSRKHLSSKKKKRQE